MTADPNGIDLSTFVSEHLRRAEPDLRPRTAAAARSGSTPATATGPGTGTPGQAASS